MSHFLIHAARLQDAGISHLLIKLDAAKDGTRLMRVIPHMPYDIATNFPERTFELCGTDRLLEQLEDDMAYSDGGPTPEKLAAAIEKHPLAADDLRAWYADWLLNPPLTDEDIANAPEPENSQVDKIVQWTKGVMRGLDIARQRDAMKTPSSAAGGAQEFCRFPDCRCPMDPGPEPDWCARGLPHSAGVRGKGEGGGDAR